VLDSLEYDAAYSPLDLSGIGLAATAGTQFSGTVAHLTDGDSTAVASDYSAQITWGDGSTTGGSVVADSGGGFDITGMHTYSAAGSFPLGISVTKIGRQTLSASSTASVSAAGSGGGGGGGGGSATGPHAAFGWYPTGELCPGQKVEFDARGSTPGSASITTYHWTFSGEPPAADGRVVVGEEPILGYPIYGSFSLVQDTAAPYNTFSYDYNGLFNPQADSNYLGPMVGVAIVGSTVTLEVEDANGLTDSVTHTLSFADTYIDLDVANPPSQYGPPCPHQADVTAPPVFPSTTPVMLQGSTVAVPFGCTGGATVCGGLVTLSTVTGPRGVIARATAAATRSIVVGQTRFALLPGHHAVIRVKLNKRGRALARRGRLHKLRVSVATVHLGPGKPKTVSRVVSVKRSRH
jgi:hypothetical protein